MTDYLSEGALVDLAVEALRNQFSTPGLEMTQEVLKQRRIGDRIIDAMIIQYSDEDRIEYKIIGIEAKTDHDTYDRLFGQIDEYLTICDEVYVVIENKPVPPKLAHYVGVIKVADGKATIVRYASTLHHAQGDPRFWLCLLDQMGGRKQIGEVFRHAENIRRKLIWNMYVAGYTRGSYHEKYMHLNDEEKKLLAVFTPLKRRRS